MHFACNVSYTGAHSRRATLPPSHAAPPLRALHALPALHALHAHRRSEGMSGLSGTGMKDVVSPVMGL